MTPSAPVLLATHRYVAASINIKSVIVNTLSEKPLMSVYELLMVIETLFDSFSKSPFFNQTIDGTGKPTTAQVKTALPAV